MLYIFKQHKSHIFLNSLSVSPSFQAWWMTNSISTDVWGRWIQTNGVWNLTDLPEGSHYPQGKTHTDTHTHTHTHTARAAKKKSREYSLLNKTNLFPHCLNSFLPHNLHPLCRLCSLFIKVTENLALINMNPLVTRDVI